MNCARAASLTVFLAGFGCVARAQQCSEVLSGDALVVSRSSGTVYSVRMDTGAVRSLITGADFRIGKSGVRGSGPSLGSLGATSLLSWHDGRILAHYGRSQTDSALVWLDPFTGNRTYAAGAAGAAFDSTGDMIALDDRFVLMTVDDYNDFNNGMTSVYKYDTIAGAITTVSGPAPINGAVRGDGPIIRRGRGIGMLNPTTLVVAESGFNPQPGVADAFGVTYQGCGVFLVDIPTGDRTFVSRLWRDGFTRPNYVGGVNVGTISLGFLGNPSNRGGTGPVVNSQVRTATASDGKIFVGTGLNLASTSFPGTLLRIDPVSGDRELLFGLAYVDNGRADTFTPEVRPGWATSPLDAPVGMYPLADGRIVFTNQFGSTALPNRVLTWDTNAGTLTSPAMTISSQMIASATDLALSGLTVYQPRDCNGDGFADSCQISKGLCSDRNADGVPDECEWTCVADYDVDGFVTFADFDAFVEDFEAGRTTADVTRDQFLDFGDFDVFVGAFESGC